MGAIPRNQEKGGRNHHRLANLEPVDTFQFRQESEDLQGLFLCVIGGKRVCRRSHRDGGRSDPATGPGFQAATQRSNRSTVFSSSLFAPASCLGQRMVPSGSSSLPQK